VKTLLQVLLTLAILGEQGYARLLGLGERILSFPVMVAAVLTLLWRQVPSVVETTTNNTLSGVSRVSRTELRRM
jgi:hypothetical protein